MSKIELIRDLTNAFGPSGFEEDVLDSAKKYLNNFEVDTDSMNNLYAKLKGNKGKRYKILLDAHSDEVGFIVQSILDNGLLSFIKLGGWVKSNIPAHLVKIKNIRGEYIEGITSSKPPHFMTDDEIAQDKLSIETMYIDIGANSKEEVKEVYGIEVGCPVAPLVDFKYNEDQGLLRGKAFDNRLGCACIIEIMNRLNKSNNLNVDVIGSFAAQEEVGMRGARITSQKVKPDLAIVFEGTPADDMYLDPSQAQGVLGKGTQIRHMDESYIGNFPYIQYAKEIADKNNIKYQSAVRRGGSTNAGVIHLSNEGVPVLVLGVPSRYVHTHYNYAKIDDFDSTVELAVKLIEGLNDQIINKILKK